MGMHRRRKLDLFEGLLWYLEARNWAFDKMEATPHGADGFDVRMHHSLFFVNLVSVWDHLRDYLKDTKDNPDAFTLRLRNGFRTSEDYKYVCELRNSIVHRGLDLSAIVHSDQATLYVVCPAKVEDRKGKA